jgi:hypothetical protein
LVYSSRNPITQRHAGGFGVFVALSFDVLSSFLSLVEQNDKRITPLFYRLGWCDLMLNHPFAHPWR